MQYRKIFNLDLILTLETIWILELVRKFWQPPVGVYFRLFLDKEITLINKTSWNNDIKPFFFRNYQVWNTHPCHSGAQWYSWVIVLICSHALLLHYFCVIQQVRIITAVESGLSERHVFLQNNAQYCTNVYGINPLRFYCRERVSIKQRLILFVHMRYIYCVDTLRAKTRDTFRVIILPNTIQSKSTKHAVSPFKWILCFFCNVSRTIVILVPEFEY